MPLPPVNRKRSTLAEGAAIWRDGVFTVKERGLPLIGEYWRGLSFETKAALAVLAGVLVVLAGFFAATGVSGLAPPSETGADEALVETLTIKRVVTHTSSGERTVVRTVRVVRQTPSPLPADGRGVADRNDARS